MANGILYIFRETLFTESKIRAGYNNVSRFDVPKFEKIVKSIKIRKTNNKDTITYENIVCKMKKYENKNNSSGKERLVLYTTVFLQEGLNSGKILIKELVRYTYLFECNILMDGRIQSVAIKDTPKSSDNDQYFIDYLMTMPRCKFWKSYNGSDKDSITTIYIPLKF